MKILGRMAMSELLYAPLRTNFFRPKQVYIGGRTIVQIKIEIFLKKLIFCFSKSVAFGHFSITSLKILIIFQNKFSGPIFSKSI